MVVKDPLLANGISAGGRDPLSRPSLVEEEKDLGNSPVPSEGATNLPPVAFSVEVTGQWNRGDLEERESVPLSRGGPCVVETSRFQIETDEVVKDHPGFDEEAINR